MANYDASYERFRPDLAGISEVFTSGAMQSVLGSLTDDMRGMADELGHLHRTDRRPRYASGVDVLTHTAVGWVGTGDMLSRIDQAYHHTLDSLRH